MMAAHSLRHTATLRQLLAGVVEVDPSADRPVTGLAIDSRKLARGDLFLALAGTRGHGLDHLDAALGAGAVAVLWEPAGEGAAHRAGWRSTSEGVRVPLIPVPDLAQQVGTLADRFYGHPSQDLYVVGVTGTNGKTSCSHFIAQALDRDGGSGLIGTLGAGRWGALEPSSHTTPDAVAVHARLAALRERGARQAVMEVSSHGLVQGRVGAVAFACAVFTNLSRDHLDYHGDMDAYAAAKRRLFEQPGLGCAVINADDAYGRELIAALRGRMRVISYGLEACYRPAILGRELRLGLEGLSMTVATAEGAGTLHSTLLGRFNASNLLAAVAVLQARGLPLADTLARLAETRPVPGRMQAFGGHGRQPLVVVDYAHTPDALTQALAALREHTAHRLWCVFGCGGERDRGKRAQMGAAAEHHADLIVVTDDNPRSENPVDIIEDTLAGMHQPDAVYVLRDRQAAIRLAITQAEPGDVVLIAGKGHEDYQEAAGVRRPFSDIDAVRQTLQEMPS